MSDSEEEMVAVYLGASDYETNAYFSTDPTYERDYLVPRSQFERWEAAKAAWIAVEREIERVMDEQRERVRALNAQRPKSQLGSWVEKIYGPVLQQQLENSAFADKVLRQEGQEDEVPFLVAGSKIDREEEERGL